MSIRAAKVGAESRLGAPVPVILALGLAAESGVAGGDDCTCTGM